MFIVSNQKEESISIEIIKGPYISLCGCSGLIEPLLISTVNSEIFARVFIFTKFHENKPSGKVDITLSFTL